MTTATRRIASGLALASVAGMLLAGCATTDNGSNGDNGNNQEVVRLQFSSPLGNTPPQALALEVYLSLVEERSNGTIEIERFWEGSLLDGTSTLSGVASGRADIGHVMTIYNPSELPLTQVVSIPFTSGDVQAAGKTFADLLENNEAYRAEWDKAGVEIQFVIATAPSFVSAPEKVTGYDWLEGKQLRASGYVAEALLKAGGNPIALPVVDVYEAIQRGTIDGYTNMILDTVPALSLEEVSPWIAEAGIGLYTVNAIAFNKDVWNSLSDEHKKLFQDAEADFEAAYLEKLGEVEDNACQLLIEQGGGATVWSDADQKKWSDAIGTFALDKWKSDAQASGADVEAFYNEFITTLRSYEGSYVNGITRCAEVTP